ncbi:MAG: M23 family metallopeptidase [Lachnospiraceae bacterium]|nr:M23 family metallopeptidase [Lachnospiraceae bacterium]
MKEQRHKRKETFSILLISNTGQSNRHFHISLFSLRMLVLIPVLVGIVIAGLAYQLFMDYGNEAILRSQIVSQSQMMQQLEDEKEALNNEKLELTAENEALQMQLEDSYPAEADAEEPKEDTSFPSRYPCSETGMLAETYSAEHPYLSISMQAEGSIVAAGDGTVALVGSDDTYPLIIEIEHGSGYKTRYMCLQDAASKPQEGTDVKIGDTLVTVETDTAQLDYQVLFNDQPIDPLMVLDAKG